jgi:hypothetical protein
VQVYAATAATTTTAATAKNISQSSQSLQEQGQSRYFYIMGIRESDVTFGDFVVMSNATK